MKFVNLIEKTLKGTSKRSWPGREPPEGVRRQGSVAELAPEFTGRK